MRGEGRGEMRGKDDIGGISKVGYCGSGAVHDNVEYGRVSLDW